MSYRRAFLLCLLFLSSCAGSRHHDGAFEAAGGDECRDADSMLASSGWRQPLEMKGDVTFDVKQYRVQGRFVMTAPGDGNLTFEFSGNMVMGGHHEDVVVSYYDGLLRILDRERGRFFEGDEANSLVSEGLDLDWDAAEMIRWVTAQPLECSRLSSVSVSGRGSSGARLQGRVDGETFRADFEDGRITGASWPVMSAGRVEDKLVVTYDWASLRYGTPVPSETSTLDELVLFLEGRRWRIKLTAD